MSDLDIRKEDEDLVYFFKNFEEILIAPKKQGTDIITAGVDFRVFKEYLIDDVRAMQQKLLEADDEYLLYVCEHIYDITDWIALIVGNRGEAFNDALEEVFEEVFNNRQVLHDIYNESLRNWISEKSGQHKLGGNTYTILDGEVYYHDRFGGWFNVDLRTAFDLQPNKEAVSDQSVIQSLDETYQATPSDILIEEWNKKNFQGSLKDDFLEFDKELTSPEEYFEFTLKHIKDLLDSPVSLNELERWSGSEITNLEDTVKLGSMALDIVRDRRNDSSHTVYLLRDCMVFYEMHKTLDLLHSKDTSSDQLMIGRKLLSHKPDQWGYYIVMLEALYEAHLRFPDNFGEFYNEFSRLMDLFVSLNAQFKTVIHNLATYIKKHVHTNKDKVVIFDVGFQGSINLFIKYVIDSHINPSEPENKINSEIEVSVGALWSKELFEGRAKGFYFPFLNRIQYMARSDELYHYKFGSLNDGKLQVTMGNKEWQKKAAIELVVLTMITKLIEEKE